MGVPKLVNAVNELAQFAAVDGVIIAAIMVLAYLLSRGTK